MDNTSESGAKKNTFTDVRQWMGNHKAITAILAVVVIGLVGSLGQSTSSPVPAAPASAPQTAQTPTMSAAEATSQFKDIIGTAETANLVSSYEFSPTNRVIYVTDVWYTQTVSFKKDFLAKVAMLQGAINGKYYFEVHDDHSNEKVAEVTPITNSLQVYK